MRVFAIIPAAGFGSRMRSAVSKQFLLVGDRPILAHTIGLFERHPLVDQIILVVPPAEVEACRLEIVEGFGFTKVAAVVAGGAERQDSVRRGLAVCSGDDADVVLIHDGVRPCFNSAHIPALVERIRNEGACIVAVPVKDTIKQVAKGVIVATPDRQSLWQAQTPQGFHLGLIRRAHQAAFADGYSGTDDASLLERLGFPVAILEGEYCNIKITTAEDLLLARTFIASAGECNG